jgi:hypothetical protein
MMTPIKENQARARRGVGGLLSALFQAPLFFPRHHQSR